MKKLFSKLVLCTALFCMSFSAAAHAAESKGAAKATPASPPPLEEQLAHKDKNAKKAKNTAKKPKTTVAHAKAPAKNSKVTSKSDSPEAVQTKLDAFAQKTLASMNKNIRPGISAKEVVQNADGSYTCRYYAMDPKSLRTSYKKPEAAKVITYIGVMDYHEVEYVCHGTNKEEAMNGPFKEARRVPTTELVKYVKGVWRY